MISPRCNHDIPPDVLNTHYTGWFYYFSGFGYVNSKNLKYKKLLSVHIYCIGLTSFLSSNCTEKVRFSLFFYTHWEFEWCDTHAINMNRSCLKSPCIMCVQYRGGAQYRGGYHEYRGGISWVPWGVQYCGGYHDKCGGYLEYCGGVQYRGGTSWVPWGVILSTVGDVQYRGGYHDARGGYHEYRGGCSVPWGKVFYYLSTPWYWTPPTVLMISPHMYHDIPHGTQISKDDIPHGTEHPHGTHDIPPRASWYPPTCIMISPHGTEHPPRYSR